jgi:hypothetical protein
MSTIKEFFGSLGFTSPNPVPTIFSYGPTPAKKWPPNVGDSDLLLSTTNFVSRACAALGTSNVNAIPTSKRWIAEFRGQGRIAIPFCSEEGD